MRTTILFLFIIIISGNTFSQSFEIWEGDTVNRTDADLNKYGLWIHTKKGSNQKASEGNYADNKKHGLWKTYYPGGALLSEITYNMGRKQGPAKIYHENGTLAEEGVWKHNKWVGEYKSYYPDGQLAVHWEYNEEGNRDGRQLYYHKNGNIKIEGKWVNGDQNGVVKEYYKNGTLKSEKSYENGDILENGIVFYDKNEKNPVRLDEEEETENKTDNKKVEVFSGEGYRTFYTKDKKVEKEGYFRNGYLYEGKQFIYNSKGKLVKTIIYKEGKRSEEIIHD